jgi:glycosyltransferase involved in cell wall biosynthesis
MTSLVSIIIPCYNAEKWIKECIDSALSQTYSPIEVIVIDDGSTDNSLSIIKKYGDKVRWVSYENGGVSTARNKGIQLSQGEFIQFIDADDYISPLKIEEQLRMLKASNVDVVYSDWCNQYHELDGSIKLADYKTHQPTDDILYYSLAYNKIHIGSCLYKCEVLEKVLGFDESLQIAEDYDFFIRLALAKAKFVYQPGCHYFYRLYNSNTASHGRGIEHPNYVQLALDKTSLSLAKKGLLTSNSNYCHALAKNYFMTTKSYLMLGELTQANLCYRKCKDLSYNRRFKADGNSKFEKTYNLLGWELLSKLIYMQKIISNRLKYLTKIFGRC